MLLCVFVPVRNSILSSQGETGMPGASACERSKGENCPQPAALEVQNNSNLSN